MDIDGERIQKHLYQAIDHHGVDRKLRVDCGYRLINLDVTGVEAVDRQARYTVKFKIDTDGDDNAEWFDALAFDVDPFNVFYHSRRQSDGRITEILRGNKIRTPQQWFSESVGGPPAPRAFEGDLRCEGGRPARAEDELLQTSGPPLAWLFPPPLDSETNVDELGRPAPPLPVGTFLGDNLARIHLEPSVAQDLRKYINAVSGDPKSASGAGLRMLYLSVVTVTTLGLGDITPLTTAARLAVGGESVLGIVFIGLFLNAIASRERPRERQKPSSEEHPGPGSRDRPEPTDGGSSEPINEAPDQ